jgi:hypothetical protein
MKEDYSKGSIALVLLIIIGFITLGMVAFIFSKSIKFIPQTAALSPTPTAGNSTPTIEVKDYAPKIPMSQKTTILIRHSDSSESKYIVPVSMTDTYIRSLPMGDEVVSKSQ